MRRIGSPGWLIIAKHVDSAAETLRWQRLLEASYVKTEDKDFGDLVFRHGRSVPGVILSRIDPAMHELKRVRLDAAIHRFGDRMQSA